VTRSVWHRLDHLQPLLVGMLSLLGLMTIYSAHADWVRQVLWVVLGVAAYSAASALDYRRLHTLAPALYAVMVLLLVAVHLVGRTALGARRWLSVGGFPLEPSELSKLLLVLILAAYLSRRDRLSWRALGGVLLLVTPPAYLILTQPDLGTTIVFVAVLMGMLFLAGARAWQLGSLVGAALVALPLLPFLLHGYQRRRLEIFLNPAQDPLGAGYNLLQARIAVGAGGLFGMGWLHGLQGQLGSLVGAAAVAIPLLPYLLHGYQRRRLEIFLDPNQDPLGAGYNLLQARIAVGAGGMFGQGWLHGLQGQLGFVPERATDFVFAIFAEEFGLFGSLLLLIVFGTLLIRILRAAAFAPDRFGELLAGGVFVLILVQVVENVGMNIGLLPIAGIPLPLISYGGSATITTMGALGVVQSVALRRRASAYRDGSNVTLGTITRRAQA
jgi:rod shape determining protein RodA